MTDKLNGIKPGDRVKTEAYGSVNTLFEDGDIGVFLDGAFMETVVTASEINAPTFQITRIEPELAVGDVVTWDSGNQPFEVVAIKGDRAVLWNESSKTSISDYLCTLTRVAAK